jgi:hypothetical protein
MIKPLITKTDIKKLKSKDFLSPEEFEIVTQCDLLETKIQQQCKRIFDNWIVDSNYAGMFVQVDNGREIEKKDAFSKFRKFKKAREGTISGFPDVMLLVADKNKKKFECFIEFKRPGITKMTKKQEVVHKDFEKMGYDVHLINNTIYFKKVILNRITDYFSNV